MIEERAKKIKLLILDVDGVLTEGHIIYDNFGDELNQKLGLTKDIDLTKKKIEDRIRIIVSENLGYYIEDVQTLISEI
ncbi:MAG: hypothetical protein KKB46_00910, partial [Candidatus Omnitrophica bacterium]|nr:hypothetical protein [Candidatus Omnitrophota bacterium]